MFKTQESRLTLIKNLILLGSLTYIFVKIAGWQEGLMGIAIILGMVVLVFAAVSWTASGK